MFEDMTCTSTKINVLFMDVDQTAICLGTRKDANDVTEFKIDKIIAVRPKMPKDIPANRAIVELVHEEGLTHFKVGTKLICKIFISVESFKYRSHLYPVLFRWTRIDHETFYLFD